MKHYRITGSTRLEETSKIAESNLWPNTNSQTLHHIAKIWFSQGMEPGIVTQECDVKTFMYFYVFPKKDIF